MEVIAGAPGAEARRRFIHDVISRENCVAKRKRKFGQPSIVSVPTADLRVPLTHQWPSFQSPPFFPLSPIESINLSSCPISLMPLAYDDLPAGTHRNEPTAPALFPPGRTPGEVRSQITSQAHFTPWNGAFARRHPRQDHARNIVTLSVLSFAIGQTGASSHIYVRLQTTPLACSIGPDPSCPPSEFTDWIARKRWGMPRQCLRLQRQARPLAGQQNNFPPPMPLCRLAFPVPNRISCRFVPLLLAVRTFAERPAIPLSPYFRLYLY